MTTACGVAHLNAAFSPASERSVQREPRCGRRNRSAVVVSTRYSAPTRPTRPQGRAPLPHDPGRRLRSRAMPGAGATCSSTSGWHRASITSTSPRLSASYSTRNPQRSDQRRIRQLGGETPQPGWHAPNQLGARTVSRAANGRRGGGVLIVIGYRTPAVRAGGLRRNIPMRIVPDGGRLAASRGAAWSDDRR